FDREWRGRGGEVDDGRLVALHGLRVDLLHDRGAAAAGGGAKCEGTGEARQDGCRCGQDAPEGPRIEGPCAEGAKARFGGSIDEPEGRLGRVSVSPVRGWWGQVTIGSAARDAKLL